MKNKEKTSFDKIFESLSWSQPLSKKDIKRIFDLAKLEGANEVIEEIISHQIGKSVNGKFQSVVLTQEIEKIQEKLNKKK